MSHLARLGTVALVATFVSSLFLLTAGPVAADTFTNSNHFKLYPVGLATPYPSTITVNGLSGTITKVTLTLINLDHSDQQDVNMLLVGPGGQKVLVWSLAGGLDCGPVTITLDDGASTPIPF